MLIISKCFSTHIATGDDYHAHIILWNYASSLWALTKHFDPPLSLAYISERHTLVQVLPLCKSYCYLLMHVCILPENCNQTHNAYIWCTHLGLIAIKMHICMSSQQMNLVYTLWQEVPKLAYAFWTCKPVHCTTTGAHLGASTE